MAKVGLVILFSIILTSTRGDFVLVPTGSLIELAGLALREILVGVMIGFVFTLLFMAVHGGGSIIGYQVGFHMAQVVDPTTQDQQSVMAQIWFVVAMLIFLSIDGHHLVIRAFNDSYTVMPPGHVVIASGVGDLIVRYTTYVFVVALKIAAPVMVTLFLTDVALGTVAKMMPTMNVFIVGFPLKIGVGLVVVAMSLPIFAYVLRQATIYLDKRLGFLLAVMGEA